MNLTTRLLLVALTDYGFPESPSTTCCTTCKREHDRSQSACVNYVSGSPSWKLQWFLTMDSGNSWRDDSVNSPNDGTWPGAVSNKKFSTPCRECPPGWYKRSDTCLCARCTSACSAGQYDNPTCTPTTNRVCSTCRTCGIGEEKISECGGTADTGCRSCPSGTYRDQAVVNTQTTCKACKTCDTTQRQYRSGCFASSDEACPQCSEGNIVVQGTSTDSCSTCASGKYAQASSNTCQTCTTCDRTQAESRACEARANRECTACTLNRYSKNLNGNCDGCIRDYYKTLAGSCASCTDSCGNGNYKTCTFTETGGGTRTCTSCEGQTEAHSPKCNAGYGVNTRCDGQGTSMVSCTACGPGTDRPAGTAIDASINYQTCLKCGLGKYKSASGAQNCGDCTNKPNSNAQYVAWGSQENPTSNSCPW